MAVVRPLNLNANARNSPFILAYPRQHKNVFSNFYNSGFTAPLSLFLTCSSFPIKFHAHALIKLFLLKSVFKKALLYRLTTKAKTNRYKSFSLLTFLPERNILQGIFQIMEVPDFYPVFPDRIKVLSKYYTLCIP